MLPGNVNANDVPVPSRELASPADPRAIGIRTRPSWWPFQCPDDRLYDTSKGNGYDMLLVIRTVTSDQKR